MDRLGTGVAGLDHVLGGGLPVGSLLIIAGNPGTGKTILAQQMCFANARQGRKAVYFTTLSEPHGKLVRHLESFAFFDPAALGRSVELVHLAPVGGEGGVEGVAPEIIRKCYEERPAIVVVDSSRALRELSSPASYRGAVYDLASRAAHTGAVLVLVGAYDEEDLAGGAEFAVADSVVSMANEASGPFDRRWLRVLKLRGSDYLSGRHGFRIGPEGIELYERLESAPVPRGAGAEGRVATGAPGLDEMMRGGIPATDQTLVAGPSGAGKTVLGLQFVAEGASRGERCLYISLQENEVELLRKARSFGWDLSRQDPPEGVSFLYIQPVELGLDAVGARVRDAVREIRPHRVVLDSITEIERAARGSDRFADYLWSLVELFRAAGSTSVLTVETRTFFGASFELAYGASFVVDNIVLLRYAELESEIRRALGVVKMRQSDHVKSLVEFEIGGQGLRLKGKFAGLAGVLTGTPVRAAEQFREFFNR